MLLKNNILFLIFVFTIIGCVATSKSPNNNLSKPSYNHKGVYYTVKPGDTLWKIAKQFDVPVDTIKQSNNLTQPNIEVGMTLFIPNAREIKPDTFISGPIPPAENSFIWPIRGSIVSNEGEKGIYIKAYEGQDIVAVKSGKVSFVSDSTPGSGKVVNIKHSDGFISYYAYNSQILVELNQIVKQGQVIAKAGSSGRAKTPQLYFRLFKNTEPVDPLQYLR